jgi:DNA-binding FadR family transcriptional regulator
MAEYGSDGDLASLHELVTTMEQLAAGGVSIADVMDADRSFHNLVARASENRVVAAVSREIREVIGTLWGFSTLGADEVREVAEQHRRISDAITGRDAAAAAATMRDHLRWAAKADLHGLGEPAALRFDLAAGA